MSRRLSTQPNLNTYVWKIRNIKGLISDHMEVEDLRCKIQFQKKLFAIRYKHSNS